MSRIADSVAACALRMPHEPAVIDVRETSVTAWTWEKLWRESGRIANLLLRLAVKPEEVVAYQMPNRSEFVAITLAVLRIGAICCPLMPIFREHEVAFMLQRSRARVLFAADEFRGRRHAAEAAGLEAQLEHLQHLIVVKASDLRTALPETKRITCTRLYRALGNEPPDVSAIKDRAPRHDFVAQLLFTSGTSGVPKGVLHRHDVLMHAVALHRERLGIGSSDRIFVPSPLAHQTGFLYGMWLALAAGVPQILQAVWDPKRALRMLRSWRATFIQAAPTFLSDLVYAVHEGVRAPSTLRVFVPTGAPVPRALAAEAQQILHTRICGAFGTTEGCLATLGAPDDPRQWATGTDGRVLPGVRIRVCDDGGNVLPPGEEGHLQTYSPTMFVGYLDEPELTAKAFTSDGWYRTADLAVIDEEGSLHITGRANDVINRGGEKIPVTQIEQLLYQHVGIREVAIVGMPDSRLGERACAFVVARPEAIFDMKAMQAFLDEHRVAKQYWPERIELLPELPKTPSGKVKKYLLRQWIRDFSPSATAEQPHG